MRRFLPLLLILALLAVSAVVADVILPNEVTVIQAEAFRYDTSLTGQLSLPFTVTKIGDRAFEGCTGLTGTLIIPPNVQSIGSRAFADCTGLTGSVFIPASVTYLAADAFDGTSLRIISQGPLPTPPPTTDTDLPSTGTDLPSTGTDLPSTGTDLPPVTTMTDLPEGIAFSMTAEGAVITGYTGEPEAELRLPAAINGVPVVGIASGAFQDQFGLTGSIDLPDTVTWVGDYAFSGCSSLEGHVSLPEGLKVIGEGAFYECLSLTGDVVIPSTVESVGASAFAYCESMTGRLTLPADVSLGAWAFQGAGLTGSLTIPKTVTLGANVFIGTELDITYAAPAFTYKASGSLAVITGWNGPTHQGLTIPDSLNGCTVTGIADIAFAGMGLEGPVTIPGSVEFIGAMAFQDNPGISALTLHEGLRTIGELAFADCVGLPANTVLPASATEIAPSAFDNTAVVLP